ncbi:aldehyde dehydrogenase [Salipiger sp.]|uniref:aldehyde dehydrogenase n=1 Tax=Salipiger sp. TaxID=2078585 RepID=UPI003A986C46
MVWQGNFDRFFIGGGWVAPDSTTTCAVISPYTEEVIATVPMASRADVDSAVAAARAAFDHGRWPHMTIAERIAAVGRLREAFAARSDTMARTITDEMGSPITFSRNVQVRTPLAMMDTQMKIAASYPWRSDRTTETTSAMVLREPKGVVAAIVPWNVPMNVTFAKLGPALLCGCTIVLKPAPETPISAYLLAEIIAEAGLPDGVVNILPAGRDESEYLALHPGVDKVSFTGSTVAGRALAARCGELLRPITLELGGKSAALFLDDADIVAGVETLRMGSLRNSGQVCSLKTRILVSRRRENELLQTLAALIDSMPVGDPGDPATQIGPMVTKRQRERVEAYIETGIREGAQVIRGGPGRPENLSCGWFVRPTVLANVDPDATVAQEEIFGPVLAVSTYETEDEAIAIANNSTYGLNGAIFTADVERAIPLARRIRTGTVEINGGGVGPISPIGGVKQSGLGREGGPEAFDHYVELKSIGLPGAAR